MGIALTPFVLFTIKEPERKKNSLTDENTKEVQIHGNQFERRVNDLLSKMLLLLKTFIMPGMSTLCIAGGIRNAGGYVWAYNTQPFFSLKYSDTTIAAYMSVIPLVAGSIGAVVGGIISDVLVKGRGPAARIWVLIGSQVSSMLMTIFGDVLIDYYHVLCNELLSVQPQMFWLKYIYRYLSCFYASKFLPAG